MLMILFHFLRMTFKVMLVTRFNYYYFYLQPASFTFVKRHSPVPEN